MVGAVKVLEFLNEVRSEVCARCAREASGDPSSGPGNTPCGCELPLEQLVEAITAPPVASVAPVVETATTKQGEDIYCPCPEEKLAELARDVAERMEVETQQRERILEQWNDG
jgi:hypothetical protein